MKIKCGMVACGQPTTQLVYGDKDTIKILKESINAAKCGRSRQHKFNHALTTLKFSKRVKGAQIQILKVTQE